MGVPNPWREGFLNTQHLPVPVEGPRQVAIEQCSFALPVRHTS